jgi:Kelch motif protein
VNHAMAATVAGDVYVFGGYPSTGPPDAATFRLDGAGTRPVGEGAWRPVATMPHGRAAGTAVAIAEKVYVAGRVAPHGLAGQVLVYDATADSWSTAPGPPTRREHLGGAALGGLVYAIDGRTGGLDTNLDAFEAFDRGNGQWTRCPRCRLDAAVWRRPPSVTVA